MIIYHITAQADWASAQAAGVYTAESLASEGFIHASTREQVLDTARRFYAGRSGLVLLAIDTQRVTPEVRFEPVQLATGLTTFPHIYGPLNPDAVVGQAAFDPDASGAFHFPAEFAAY